MTEIEERAPAPSRRHWHCEVCRGWVLPRLPHWGWRVAEVTFWVVILALTGIGSKGPGMVLLPIIFMMGAALAGPLHALAAADPRCPGCTRYLTRPVKKR